MSVFEINIDGASKGNPGPSGVGVVICKNGAVIKNISQFIGEATNNIAEYTALIYALQEALILKAQVLKIKTDSELLAKQINGEYKVKHKNIIPLYTQAKHLMTGFKCVEVTHVMRENNCGADKLADLACRRKIAV